MSNEFTTSWITIIVLFVIGVFNLKYLITKKEDTASFSTNMKGYIFSIGVIIYSVSVTIAKLLGKI
jgi:hypothetical protein